MDKITEEIHESYEKNRKLALRFLKETGLLNKWKEYLKSVYPTKCHWYNYIMPYNIFGTTTFTQFLAEHKKMIFRTSITMHFLAYLTFFHGYHHDIIHVRKGELNDLLHDFPNLKNIIDG